ncbi:MAG: hypothetical protein HY791_21550 [Deltaproteobacteria bacterium]|nr:hypothetical protein [Deltaproteobacteria bacterium]
MHRCFGSSSALVTLLWLSSANASSPGVDESTRPAGCNVSAEVVQVHSASKEVTLRLLKVLGSFRSEGCDGVESAHVEKSKPTLRVPMVEGQQLNQRQLVQVMVIGNPPPLRGYFLTSWGPQSGPALK